jgi:hypothetical protein
MCKFDVVLVRADVVRSKLKRQMPRPLTAKAKRNNADAPASAVAAHPAMAKRPRPVLSDHDVVIPRSKVKLRKREATARRQKADARVHAALEMTVNETRVKTRALRLCTWAGRVTETSCDNAAAAAASPGRKVERLAAKTNPPALAGSERRESQTESCRTPTVISTCAMCPFPLPLMI